MKLLISLSNLIIPVFVFYVVMYGFITKIPVYDVFIKGIKEGLKTVVNIVPTMVGLMVGVGIIKASGLLETAGSFIGKLTAPIGFPGELVPLSFVKMFSSSAATGLVLNIFKEYGPDSEIGLITSLMMSSTETVFYTMSVYFMVAKVKKIRFTLAGALLATLAGTIASVVLAKSTYSLLF